MLQSMTGYGAINCKIEGMELGISIKSLNSKNIDIKVKIPHILNEYELVIRKKLLKKLNRGKIDFILDLKLDNYKAKKNINKPILKEYYKEINQISEELKLPKIDSLKTLFAMPDVLCENETKLNDKNWLLIEKQIDIVIEKLIQFRKQEGDNLYKEILIYVNEIEKIVKFIELEKDERIVIVRKKLMEKLTDLKLNFSFDQSRFEQEMFFYIERYDISEEITRLYSHLNYFKEILQTDLSGKKMIFITQEIGREINTIGSKSNDYNLQKEVVIMKDYLEKIKEQTLNVL